MGDLSKKEKSRETKEEVGKKEKSLESNKKYI